MPTITIDGLDFIDSDDRIATVKMRCGDGQWLCETLSYEDVINLRRKCLNVLMLSHERYSHNPEGRDDG